MQPRRTHFRLGPVLLRPRLIPLVRRPWARSDLPGTWLKNALLFSFIAFLLWGLLESTVVGLQRLYATPESALIGPVVPLHLMFVCLLGLMVLSGLVGTLATLFLAKDIELILASPVSWSRLFWGKVLEITTLASWFPLLLVVPVLTGFGIYFEVGISFYVGAVVILCVLLLLGTSSAMTVVTLLARFVPAARFRQILVATALLGMVVAYLLFQSFVPPSVSTSEVSEILRKAIARHSAHNSFEPAFLGAAALDALRRGDWQATFRNVAWLGAMTALSMTLAYLALQHFFEQSFSRARSAKSMFRIDSRRAQRRGRKLLWFVSSPVRALISKEYKLFARDMIQALQLMVLLGLCVMYLYNFQILRAAGETAPIAQGARLWWNAILVIMNLGVGGLVITTVCMRFVFPSVSLEGQSFWILQVAPVSPAELLRAKFWCWLVPLGTITSVIMASGALAIQAEPRIVAVSAFVSWVFCYGIVGLAVGLGAFFANFSWEHPAQLTASFGALVYLLLSVVLIAGAMVPTSVLVLLRTARSQGMTFPPLQWALFVVLASAFVVYLNFIAHRWAMKLGAQALSISR